MKPSCMDSGRTSVTFQKADSNVVAVQIRGRDPSGFQRQYTARQDIIDLAKQFGAVVEYPTPEQKQAHKAKEAALIAAGASIVSPCDHSGRSWVNGAPPLAVYTEAQIPQDKFAGFWAQASELLGAEEVSIKHAGYGSFIPKDFVPKDISAKEKRLLEIANARSKPGLFA